MSAANLAQAPGGENCNLAVRRGLRYHVPMGAAFFYHLTENPLEVTLRTLLKQSGDRGWRVLIRGPQALLGRLDADLWLGAEDAFLPHGLAGGPHDADQPVLLGEGLSSDGFNCVMSVAGAALDTDEVGRLERSCVLFDGGDDAAVEVARGQWRRLTGAGIAAQYWAQDGGRWVKKAESGAEES